MPVTPSTLPSSTSPSPSRSRREDASGSGVDRWLGRVTSALLLITIALLITTVVALPGVARREIERRLHSAAASRGLVLSFDTLELGTDLSLTLRGVSVLSRRDSITVSTDLVHVRVSPLHGLFGGLHSAIRSVETGDIAVVSPLDESIDGLLRRLAEANRAIRTPSSSHGRPAQPLQARHESYESAANRLFSGRSFHVTVETTRSRADVTFEVDVAARHVRTDATFSPGAVSALPTLERLDVDATIDDLDGLKRAMAGDGRPEGYVRGRVRVSPPLTMGRELGSDEGARLAAHVGGVEEALWDGRALTISPVDIDVQSDGGESGAASLTSVRVVLSGESEGDLDTPRIELVGARGTMESERLPRQMGRSATADRVTLHLGEAVRDALVLRCWECLLDALRSPRDVLRAVSATGLTGEAHGHVFGLARALLVRSGQSDDFVLSATGEFGPLGSRSDAWMDARLTLSASGRPRSASVALTGVGSRLDPTGVTRVLAIPESSRADLFLDVDFETGDRVTATGQVAVRALELAHWRIAKGPVGPIEGRADLGFAWDRSAGTASARVTDARIGSATGSVSLDLEALHGTPRFEVSLTIPDQDCQSLADAVPRALLETAGRLDVTGRAALEARLDVDLTNPEDLTFETRGSLSDCTIASLGMAVDGKLASLSQRFTFEPIVNGQLVDVKVGPGTRNWVARRKIPRFIAEAAMGTEDGGFYKHGGMKESLIRGALKLNFKHRRYVYGGSTITQQLVKNLFLTRTKNLARKFEEAVIATAVERSLSKERILELYLNCIEYGPKIWGIKKAARAYFGKEVEDLAAVEGLFLMAIKPYPVHAYYVARDGRWSERWVERMRGVFEKMVRRGYVTREEMDAAAPLYKPEFTGLRFARSL